MIDIQDYLRLESQYRKACALNFKYEERIEQLNKIISDLEKQIKTTK